MIKISVTASRILTAADKDKITRSIHDHVNPPFLNKPNHTLIFTKGILSNFHEKMSFPKSGGLSFRKVSQPSKLLIEVDYVFSVNDILEILHNPYNHPELGTEIAKLKSQKIGNLIILLDRPAEQLKKLFQEVEIVGNL